MKRVSLTSRARAARQQHMMDGTFVIDLPGGVSPERALDAAQRYCDEWNRQQPSIEDMIKRLAQK